MNQTTAKSKNGSPDPAVQSTGKESAGIVSELLGIDACPECGSIALEFGSRDPCEGDWWWCQNCDCGPILFPLGHVETIGTVVRRQAEIQRIRKARQPSLIDADIDTAAQGIQGRAAAIQDTAFADREPFDPAKAINDIVCR